MSTKYVNREEIVSVTRNEDSLTTSFFTARVHKNRYIAFDLIYLPFSFAKGFFGRRKALQDKYACIYVPLSFDL